MIIKIIGRKYNIILPNRNMREIRKCLTNCLILNSSQSILLFYKQMQIYLTKKLVHLPRVVKILASLLGIVFNKAININVGIFIKKKKLTNKIQKEILFLLKILSCRWVMICVMLRGYGGSIIFFSNS
jgi:hypothetical protein